MPVKLHRVQISTLMIIMVFIALNLGAVRPSIFNRWGVYQWPMCSW